MSFKKVVNSPQQPTPKITIHIENIFCQLLFKIRNCEVINITVDDGGSGHGEHERLIAQRSVYINVEPQVDKPATWFEQHEGVSYVTCCNNILPYDVITYHNIQVYTQFEWTWIKHNQTKSYPDLIINDLK